MFNPVIKIEICDDEYEIEFIYVPPEPQEWDYPGAPEEIELISVRRNGNFCEDFISDLLKENYYDKIKDAIETKIKNYNRMMEESSYA